MKTNRILLIFLIFAAFCITGCGSIASLFITTVQYSFAGDGNENGTAAITFVKQDKTGVRLVDYEGAEMPSPAEKTKWDAAVLFPAGRPLDLRVYVYWNEDRYGERRRGIFKCPPLEVGKEYKLWFRGNYKKGGSLTLTYANVTSLNSRAEIVYEQAIPALK